MRLALGLLVAAAIAAFVGLGSVRLVLDRDLLSGRGRQGAWEVWPRAGDPDDNPYAAAALALADGVPLGPAEGIALAATVDSAGAALDPACTYRIEGRFPLARLWTIAVTDAAGALPVSPAGRFGLVGDDILWRADGVFAIVVAPAARAGNWIPTAGLASLRIAVRLYDTLWSGDPGPALPTITRESCP